MNYWSDSPPVVVPLFSWLISTCQLEGYWLLVTWMSLAQSQTRVIIPRCTFRGKSRCFCCSLNTWLICTANYWFFLWNKLRLELEATEQTNIKMTMNSWVFYFVVGYISVGHLALRGKEHSQQPSVKCLLMLLVQMTFTTENGSRLNSVRFASFIL